MSSRWPAAAARWVLPVIAVALVFVPRTLRSLEITEVPLSFYPTAGAAGLEAALDGLGSLAGVGQLVLELPVRTPSLPASEPLLLDLLLRCGPNGQGEELFSSMDLFSVAEDSVSRRVLFDLTPLAAADSLPCALQGALLRLSPIGTAVDLVLDSEASDGKLQVIRY